MAGGPGARSSLTAAQLHTAPPPPRAGGHQPLVPPWSQRDPNRNHRQVPNAIDAISSCGGWRELECSPHPGKRGLSEVSIPAPLLRHHAGNGLQSALTGSSILVRVGRCCLCIHQSIIPQNALPASILIPFRPRVTALIRRRRGVNLTTEGH